MRHGFLLASAKSPFRGLVFFPSAEKEDLFHGGYNAAWLVPPVNRLATKDDNLFHPFMSNCFIAANLEAFFNNEHIIVLGIFEKWTPL
jgi:hypothetical protein